MSDNNMNELNNGLEIPACMKFKYPAKCKICNLKIEPDTVGFYHGKSKACYHIKCGAPEWKAPGTPYDKRRQTAIGHQTKSELPFNVRLKLILRRFRINLQIRKIDVFAEPDVLVFLLNNKLIGEHYDSYNITPLGFNWDVDKLRYRELDSSEYTQDETTNCWTVDRDRDVAKYEKTRDT